MDPLEVLQFLAALTSSGSIVLVGDERPLEGRKR
jgi:hypothetical protein